MNTPHKHAALIKAWADGAVIQYRYHDNESWQEPGSHGCLSWAENCQYRIKPEPVVVKYRRYLTRALSGELRVYTFHNSSCHSQTTVVHQNGFVRWIDNDWITEEV